MVLIRLSYSWTLACLPSALTCSRAHRHADSGWAAPDATARICPGREHGPQSPDALSGQECPEACRMGSDSLWLSVFLWRSVLGNVCKGQPRQPEAHSWTSHPHSLAKREGNHSQKIIAHLLCSGLSGLNLWVMKFLWSMGRIIPEQSNQSIFISFKQALGFLLCSDFLVTSILY